MCPVVYGPSRLWVGVLMARPLCLCRSTIERQTGTSIAAERRRADLRRLEDTIDALYGDRATLETSKKGESYHCVLRLQGTPAALVKLLEGGD